MTIGSLSLKNDDNKNCTWLSLTNNEIGTISIAELAEALHGHCAVRKVSCHAGFLASLSPGDLMRLVETVVGLSQLRDLWLALPSHRALLSADIARTIVSQPCRLQKLALQGMDDAGCRVLAEALQRPDSTTLVQLQIRGTKVTRVGVVAIAKMLHVNRTLERLDISYRCLEDTLACCQAMAAALSVNQQLKKLDLLAAATPKGQNYESFSKGYDALVHCMKTNYTIHYINTAAQGDQKFMLDLFSRLNRSGARGILRNSNHTSSLEDVLDVLQQYIQNSSALYELLSIHPALWDPVKASAKGPADKKLEKKDSHSTTKAHASLPGPILSKPVMARWSENIFSDQEQAKFKRFARWTPTILEDALQSQPPKTIAAKSTSRLKYNVPAASWNVPGGPAALRKPIGRKIRTAGTGIGTKPFSETAAQGKPDARPEETQQEAAVPRSSQNAKVPEQEIQVAGTANTLEVESKADGRIMKQELTVTNSPKSPIPQITWQAPAHDSRATREQTTVNNPQLDASAKGEQTVALNNRKGDCRTQEEDNPGIPKKTGHAMKAKSIENCGSEEWPKNLLKQKMVAPEAPEITWHRVTVPNPGAWDFQADLLSILCPPSDHFYIIEDSESESEKNVPETSSLGIFQECPEFARQRDSRSMEKMAPKITGTAPNSSAEDFQADLVSILNHPPSNHIYIIEDVEGESEGTSPELSFFGITQQGPAVARQGDNKPMEKMTTDDNEITWRRATVQNSRAEDFQADLASILCPPSNHIYIVEDVEGESEGTSPEQTSLGRRGDLLPMEEMGVAVSREAEHTEEDEDYDESHRSTLMTSVAGIVWEGAKSIFRGFVAF